MEIVGVKLRFWGFFRNKINKIALEERKKEHIEKMKKIKTKNLQDQMQAKLKDMNINDLDENIGRKTREFR